MRKLNLNKLIAVGILFIAAFAIAVVTPPLASQAEPVALSSEQRATLLQDWQQQVTAWQRASATTASLTTGSMLDSKVAALPNTGFITVAKDSAALNILKAFTLTMTFIGAVILMRNNIWRRSKPTA